ncbi:MAG: indolepyruvate ferredoxin oxidoreductase family protein [Deltaproteobacteria bacterium]|nr:indolepyruvate ferredoxin oxidoreductase family protein [Deltaproteobacteria bacterium]MBW2695535.1 indolepyruvate ferredoxin oxidoreductase family protein [Deltaproteobacteria bacterium]
MLRDPVVNLDDKYALDAGEVYLSGIQALVRLPLDQAARDAAAGFQTAGFISGYRGSPLAGLDQQLWRARVHLDRRSVVFQPGLNEELAATAVWGSQQTGLHPGARYDGVFGLWYGKSPGVDRAADALRHANASGTARRGGVLLVAGDDHACKSSSYPSQSEFAMMHLEIPVLSPASVQDVIDYGLHGWAMSRYSGLWVCLLALTDWMDGSATVRVGPERGRFVLPDDFVMPPGGVHIRAADDPKDQEYRIREVKIPAAIAYARANAIDRAIFSVKRPRLVVVASGKAFTDTCQALEDLGIDASVARRSGIELVKVGMPWPLDAEHIRDLVSGADKVLVVEEKRPLIESQLKEELYTLPDALRPLVVGKRDEHGAPLLARTFELDAVEIAEALVHQLPSECTSERLDDFVARTAARELALEIRPTRTARTPFFCSGCPHNTSTRVPEGSRALVGIGCHYMVQWMDRDSDHFSQMGGEGAAWLGQAPFTDEPHVFANLGDGTYVHSGLLAIRAAVAADARITYKLLYNGAVAMTGGQAAEGAMGVHQITRQLAAEGVREIVVVTDDPGRYADKSALAAGVEVEPRSRLDAVQKRLREVEGVSVLIYDQACAAEVRRKRKRGLIPDPARRVFINELVCEGCGDCSSASNCLSVEPVQTELGRKRRINQSSCNKDYSCLDGSCPAFVSVVGGALRKRTPADVGDLIEMLPEPPIPASDGVYNLVLTGVGGTGVTTVAALLGMAAHIEGRAVAVLDMTGLAQKGGAVVSHVRLGEPGAAIHGGRVPPHAADLLLGCDMVVAASEQGLGVLDGGRTFSVLNTHLTATAAFVMDNQVRYDRDDMRERVRLASHELHSLDATRVVEGMLGDAIGSNLFLVGLAFQLGRVPLPRVSIERAIALNGVAVEMNLRAFALGRLAAHDPKLIDDWMASEERLGSEQTLDDIVIRRGHFLADYQDANFAERYSTLVARMLRLESEVVPGSRRLTMAVARNAFKLMAYKDEYEVARLYSDGRFHEALEREFEGDYRVEIHLAPPAFARRDPLTGRLVKRAYGPWMLRAMRWLAKGKRLRGTPLDPFGWLADRRLERALLCEYEAVLDEIASSLHAGNHEIACRLAELPEQVRGFDLVKAEAAASMREEREHLLLALRRCSGQAR